MNKIGKFSIRKACGERWFPRVGYGYWDGMRYFLKKPINLELRTFPGGFAIGPLTIGKDRWADFDPPFNSFAFKYCEADVKATAAMYEKEFFNAKT